MIDYGRTDLCTRGKFCEACGSTARPSVVAVRSASGPVCLTLCPDCIPGVATIVRGLTVATVNRLVTHHAAHLGVTVEELRAAWRRLR